MEGTCLFCLLQNVTSLKDSRQAAEIHAAWGLGELQIAPMPETCVQFFPGDVKRYTRSCPSPAWVPSAGLTGPWGRRIGCSQSEACLPFQCQSVRAANAHHPEEVTTACGLGWGCPPCDSFGGWAGFLPAGLPSPPPVRVRCPGRAVLLAGLLSKWPPFLCAGCIYYSAQMEGCLDAFSFLSLCT